MPGVERLPLCHLRGRLVFLGTRHREGRELGGQLIPHVLAQDGRYLSVVREVPLSARIAAPAAHVNQEGQWLRARRALVKIRSLPTERIRGNHLL